jgi:hypothetical protein
VNYGRTGGVSDYDVTLVGQSEPHELLEIFYLTRLFGPCGVFS